MASDNACQFLVDIVKSNSHRSVSNSHRGVSKSHRGVSKNHCGVSNSHRDVSNTHRFVSNTHRGVAASAIAVYPVIASQWWIAALFGVSSNLPGVAKGAFC